MDSHSAPDMESHSAPDMESHSTPDMGSHSASGMEARSTPAIEPHHNHSLKPFVTSGMGADVPAITITRFSDLADMDAVSRQALSDVNHNVQIKSQPPSLWSYTVPAGVFEVFAPAAYAQAFPVPGNQSSEQNNGSFAVLVLPPNGVDFQAVAHILDWMVKTCRTHKPFNLPVSNNFYSSLELLKAAQLLQVQSAEVRVWATMAQWITSMPLEWEHIDAIMVNFPADSKIVKHLVHNVEYMWAMGRITPSASYYISCNQFFAGLLNQVTLARQSKISGGPAKSQGNFNRYDEQEYRMRFERQPGQQLWHDNSGQGNKALRGKGKKKAAYGGYNGHNGAAYNQGDREAQYNNHHNQQGMPYNFNPNMSYNNQQRMMYSSNQNMAYNNDNTNIQDNWNSAPAEHQGGAYDVGALGPGEATASGPIA